MIFFLCRFLQKKLVVFFTLLISNNYFIFSLSHFLFLVYRVFHNFFCYFIFLFILHIRNKFIFFACVALLLFRLVVMAMDPFFFFQHIVSYNPSFYF